MAAKLFFPPYQGLPFTYLPPTPDGFVEWEIGVPTAEIETGWVGATRVDYGGASGLASMSFQGVSAKDSSSIYMSFIVRFDLNYDDNDAIIIILQQTLNNAALDVSTRRLLIRPNSNPDGAGFGPPVSDFSVSVPGMGGVTEQIPVRTNRDPAGLTISKWDPGTGAWTDIPNTGAGSITNLAVKARSWKISNNDNDWSVEIWLPAKVAGPLGGGNNWIDLNPTSFGLYFNVLRFSTPGQTVNFNSCTEFSWPRDSAPISDANSPGGAGYLSLGDIVITAASIGEAAIGAGGEGVYFDGGWNSIGVLAGGVVTGVVDGTLGAVNQMVAKLKNNSTTTDAPGVRATFRIADFGIGPGGNPDWAMIDQTLAAPAPNSNPTDRVSVPKGDVPVQLKMNWQIDAAVRAKFLGHGNDQCLLVELDSDQNAQFKENSYRANLSFKNLSTAHGDIVVSGKGYGPPPASQLGHEFILVTSHRFMSSSIAYDGWQPGGVATIPRARPNIAEAVRTGGGDQYGSQWGQTTPVLGNIIFDRWRALGGQNYTWIAVTSAVRRTGESLTLGGVTHALFEPADSFSHVLSHRGEVALWNFSLDGPGLTRAGDVGYLRDVSSDGLAVLKYRYEAVEPGAGASPDWLDWLRHLPWWAWLLLILLLIIVLMILLVK